MHHFLFNYLFRGEIYLTTQDVGREEKISLDVV